MSFGKNPHVAKADAAELKAQNAVDNIAHEQAWREAANQWERAASRERDVKRGAIYREKAETARACADEPRAIDGTVADKPEGEPVPDESAEPLGQAVDTRLLN